MDYYELLGVPLDADEETLQRAISQQAAQWSKRSSNAVSVESRHQAERTLQSIQEARQVLLKPEKRAEYDQALPGRRMVGQPVPDGVATDDRMPCPYCLELIHSHAKKCRWCNEWLDPSARPEVPGASQKAQPELEPEPVVVETAIVPVGVTSSEVVEPNEHFIEVHPTYQPIGPRKSRLGAAVLALVFGPFGLFYVSAGHGWGAFAVFVILCAVSGGTLGAMSWLLAVYSFWGWKAASARNKHLGHNH